MRCIMGGLLNGAVRTRVPPFLSTLYISFRATFGFFTCSNTSTHNTASYVPSLIGRSFMYHDVYFGIISTTLM